MSKHTPGPWKVCTYETDATPTFYIEAEAGELISTCRWDAPEIDEANARLIATAPELLEACRRAASGYICVGTNEYNDTCGVTFTCGQCRAAAELRAVIAKALGLPERKGEG